MGNLLEQAINCNEGDHAATIIQDALGIENDDVVKHCFPKTWPEGSRGARPHHRLLAAKRGLLSSVTAQRRFPAALVRRGFGRLLCREEQQDGLYGGPNPLKMNKGAERAAKNS